MFTKKMAVAAALSMGVAAAGLSTSVFGQQANTKEFTINISATIPAIELEVKPVGELANSQDIILPWDTTTEAFTVYTGKLTLKSNIGSINAALQDEAVIKGTTGSKEEIPLKVTFNDKDLSKKKQSVLEAAKANLQTPTELELKIVPKNPTERKPAGKYTGTVTLIFEATV